MSCSVHCPACGLDGTAAANQLMAQHLAAPSSQRVLPAVRLALPALPERLPAAAPPIVPAEAEVRMRRELRSARAKWLTPAIAAGIVLLLVLAGVVLARTHSPKPTGTHLLADGRSVPAALLELDASYIEPPAGENAATLFAEGLKALQLGNASASPLPIVGKGQMPQLGAPLSASMQSAVAAFVQVNQDALNFFARAGRLEQCRYPVDLTQGIEALFPHLPKIRNATQVLELAALWHAESNGKAAMDDVRMVLSLARSLQSEPALLSQVVRVICISSAVSTLERTLNRTVAPQTSLSELGAVLQKMEAYETQGEGFNRALTAERATSLALLTQSQSLRLALTAAGNHISAAQRAQIVARLETAKELVEEQQYLQGTFQQLQAARQANFPERLKADEFLQERLAEAEAKKLTIMNLLLPGLRGRTSGEAECLAKLRLGCAVVALEQFRATHQGRYPAALSELMPNDPTGPLTDPFDGRPLRYLPKGDGYLLYSIGPDRKDNGGERMNGKTGDIVFRIAYRPPGTN